MKIQKLNKNTLKRKLYLFKRGIEKKKLERNEIQLAKTRRKALVSRLQEGGMIR